MSALFVVDSQIVDPSVSRPDPMRGIFEELAKKVCRVVWRGADNREMITAGCFIKREDQIRIVTCFHGHMKGTISITVKDNFRRVHFSVDPGISQELAAQHDLCLLSPKIGDLSNRSSRSSKAFDVLEERPFLGETVYFAGYPLGEEIPIVHRGLVSSVTNGSFTIDGTVVAGNSGGPVVVFREGQLRLIGVINSQMVDMTKQFFESEKVPMSNYHIVPSNDVAPSYGGSDVRQVIGDIIKNLLSNLSTGIGKAKQISELNKVFRQVNPAASEISSEAEELFEEDFSRDAPSLSNRTPQPNLSSLTPSLRPLTTQQGMIPSEQYSMDTGASAVMASMSNNDTLSKGRALYNNPDNPRAYHASRGSSFHMRAQGLSSREEKVSELPTMKRHKVEQELRAYGWWKDEAKSKGNKEGPVWTNGILTESLTNHTEIKELLALKIIKTAIENPVPPKMPPTPVVRTESPGESIVRDLGKLQDQKQQVDFVRKKLQENGYYRPSPNNKEQETWKKVQKAPITFSADADLRELQGIIRKIYA